MIKSLPCIQFSKREIELIRKYGFMTFPEFLDNFYVRYRKKKFAYFRKLLKKVKDDVKIGVLPDYDYELMKELMKKHPEIEWLFPLHQKGELVVIEKLNPTWIGFPHRKEFRDYSLRWFLRNANGFRKWYLGFWAESKPNYLLCFDGFDTTLPETYSGKYGKIWTNWNESYKPRNMKIVEILEENIKNFKKRIEEIENQTKI